MDIILLIFVVILGIIIGSFLNVVILRFNTGKTVEGRSRCLSCNKQLTWFELIPIVSFLIQGGVCKKCRSKISWQYPLVESVTGFLFTLIFLQFYPYTVYGFLFLVIQLIIGCLLIVISTYDIKHKIIPDEFVYTFIGLAVISLFINDSTLFVVPSVTQIFSGPIVALPFALLWLFSKGTWMGLGDAKLLLGIGWLLGLSMAINAVILAFWIAAVISITWLLFTYHSIKAKTEIPFGPYLIIGMYVVLIFNIKVIDLDLLRELLFTLF